MEVQLLKSSNILSNLLGQVIYEATLNSTCKEIGNNPTLILASSVGRRLYAGPE
jgi:hypothetical protein